jgi:hypothetical protein
VTGPTPRRVGVLLGCALLLFAAGCGGDDDDTTATATKRPVVAGPGPSEEATVDDVEVLGPGPSPGQRWEIPVGLAVCGRFVEPPTGGPVDGVTAAPGGIAVVEPVDEASAGRAATLGGYAAAAGISLGTDEITLPGAVVPAELDLDGAEAGAGGTLTLRTGTSCGTTPAAVQVWVYSADAAVSGEDVLTVVTDPHRIPFAEEGMAIVIALAPESSLPTLPPSALGLG